jgi:hypothetical protein
MISMKRVIITTVFGLIGGALAVWMTIGVGALLPPEVIARMLLNFTMMGFAIGISTLRWHWAIHGLFFGMVMGTLEGLASVISGLPLYIPLFYGLIVGLLIELFATVVFKAGVQSKTKPTIPGLVSKFQEE